MRYLSWVFPSPFFFIRRHRLKNGRTSSFKFGDRTKIRSQVLYYDL